VGRAMKQTTNLLDALFAKLPAARVIIKTTLDAAKLDFNARHMSSDARGSFVSSVLEFQKAIDAILEHVRKRPQIDDWLDDWLKVTAGIDKYELDGDPRQLAIRLMQAINAAYPVNERRLILLIATACSAFGAVFAIHPHAKELLQATLKQTQTAPGRAGRSTKTDLGRKLVFECLDRLFDRKPGFRDKNPNAITTQIEREGELDKMLSGYRPNERPQLGHSAIRARVKEYLAKIKPA
jgi:hypothetical protein